MFVSNIIEAHTILKVLIITKWLYKLPKFSFLNNMFACYEKKIRYCCATILLVKSYCKCFTKSKRVKTKFHIIGLKKVSLMYAKSVNLRIILVFWLQTFELDFYLKNKEHFNIPKMHKTWDNLLQQNDGVFTTFTHLISKGWQNIRTNFYETQ